MYSTDLTADDVRCIVDLVAVSKFPSLERKPGKADNWVERAGGLPQYMDRIARHLVYEQGFTISHAIATAVNTVKRWARKGKVVKWHDPHNNHVTTITAAQAAADVASWEAKKASAHVRKGAKLSVTVPTSEDLVDLNALAARASQIKDPQRKSAARQKVLDLAAQTYSATDNAFIKEMQAHHKRGLQIVGKHLSNLSHTSAVSLAADHVNHATGQIQRTRWMGDNSVNDYTAEEQDTIDLAKMPPQFLKQKQRVVDPKAKTPPAFLRKQKGRARQTGTSTTPSGFPTAGARKTAAAKGNALPDGSFPINNVADLHKARKAVGRAKNPAKAKAHISKRARQLGVSLSDDQESSLHS